MNRRFFISLAILSFAACDSRPSFPPELTSFVALGDKPAFTGEPGKWDALIRERGWIVVENGVWKLYYTG
jgi:hypothetical protein